MSFNVIIHDVLSSSIAHIIIVWYPYSKASTTNLPISSISVSLSALNGRFILNNSKIGSSTPSTRTTKLPRPGFSAFISTEASQPFSERYVCILAALLLNIPHYVSKERNKKSISIERTRVRVLRP